MACIVGHRQETLGLRLAVYEFEGIPNQMTPDLIDRAWANMFVRDEVIAK